MGSQREDNPAGYVDSCTVLLHYDNMMATVKAAVVSLEEKQLRFWVRGVEATYRKVCTLQEVPPRSAQKLIWGMYYSTVSTSKRSSSKPA